MKTKPTLAALDTWALIVSGKYAGLFFNDYSFISPPIPISFRCNSDGCSVPKLFGFKKYVNSYKLRKECGIIHDFMTREAKTIKERFLADTIFNYNLKRADTISKLVFSWLFPAFTIPFGFVKMLIKEIIK